MMKIIRVNYGLGKSSLENFLLKNNMSRHKVNESKIQSWIGSGRFNRLFRLKNRNRLDTLKKQSSWRGLRLRQGLPVNGQRTHSNAKTAKRLNK